MSASLALALLLLAPPPPGTGAPPPAAAVAPTFEEMWSAWVKAEASGDARAAEVALRQIRRARIERNARSLDTVGLGLVERGVAKLDAGERAEAEETFRMAVALAPGLPDGHAGLSLALLQKGPLGVVPSVDAALTGLSAFLPTGRGSRSVRDLATVAGLLCAFGFAWALAAALLLRRGGLLRHDLEEWLGPAQSRSAALGLLLLLLLLPVATFQGWGWLPSVVARAPVRLPRPRREGPRLRGGGGGARRRPRRCPRSSSACARRGTRSTTRRSRSWRRRPGARRSPAWRRRPRATPRTATSSTCSAARGGARAATRRPRSCTGGRSPEIPPTPSPGTTSRTSSSCAGATTRPGPATARARRQGRRRRWRPPRTTTSPSPTCRSSSTRPTTRRSRTPTAWPRGSWRTTIGGSTTPATTRSSTST